MQTRASAIGSGCRMQRQRRNVPVWPGLATNGVLCVSSFPDDHTELQRMFRSGKWRLQSAHSCQDAISSLSRSENAVCAIICEERLPDGTWLDVLDSVANTPAGSPLLIVASRLADAALWGEVLNVGGYDLLAKPFNEAEVRWVLESALADRSLEGVSTMCHRAAAS
jgi:DNA-binding NtrC family response regulator